ncbi:MAG: SLBB domain-containing protein, partial [Fibrobacteres bacterium]|nr:SLBB domain-containing protein [Fibrobacterota bacterium]
MKWERRFLVALAIFFILFFSVSRFMDYRERKIRNELREIPVTIEGIVRKPGTYYVPYGTTKFEVLKVAGVLPNSDLNDIDVYAQAESGESIKVGKLEQDVAMKPEGVVK